MMLRLENGSGQNTIAFNTVDAFDIFQCHAILCDGGSSSPSFRDLKTNVACGTGVIFLRFSGERGQARGEREVLALALARLKNAKK